MASLNVTKLGQVLKLKNTGSAPASPENGMVYYDTGTNTVVFYQNGSWISLGDASAILASSITDGDTTHAPNGNAVFDALALKSDATHNHDLVYLGISATAADSAKLNGQSASYYSVATHNHDSAYLGLTAKAADADKLDGMDSTAFASASHNHDSAYLGITATAADSSKLNGQSASYYGTASDVSAKVAKAGDTMSGNLAMGGNKVTGLGAPSANGDALRFNELGANSGIATLDAGGKVPASQLPSTLMSYLGTWAASTNTPTLADGTGDAGDVYVASNAGSVDFGSGSITFAAGDWVIYSGSVWQKSINSNAVASVNSQTGVVVLDTDDVSEGATNKYFSASAAKAAAVADSISDGVTDVAPSQNAVYDALAGKASTTHNHDLAYLGITATAADSSKLNGQLASYYAVATHNHDSAYLGISAKAADSDKLDGQAASFYATASSVSAKLGNVVEDLTPELGGDLDASTKAIYSSTGLKMGSSASQFQLNKYVHSQTLTASQTNAVASSFSFAFATYSSCILEYQITEATTGEVRSGQLFVSTDGTDVAISDSYTETANVGVDWVGGINGSNVEIKYTTTANNKTMRAMQKLFLA